MARRTRKQKASANYQFVYSLENLASSASEKKAVKREFQKKYKSASKVHKKRENAKELVKYENMNLIKKDMVKSIGLAILILGTEMVIYLAR